MEIALEEMLSYRKDFPMLQRGMHGMPLIYLDSAATALKPQPVIDAITDFYQNNYGTVHRAVYQLATNSTELYSIVREKVRDLLGASSTEEIVFTKGTTEAVNLVAYSFGKAFIKPGDEILISQMEHHSNFVPWQIMCEERGAILKIIPINREGDLLLEEYKKLLSPKTKLVAFTHVSNVLGTVNPVQEMTELAHGVGAKVFIDGAQAVPHMPVDVKELDVDFYAFSSHKAYGPTAAGALYGKKELLEQLPPYQGGGAMIERVSLEETTYASSPAKFEAGTPMIASIIGMGAAIDYMMEIGLQKIRSHNHNLLKHATEKLKKVEGIVMIGESEKKEGVLSFIVEGTHPLDIATLLDLKGVALRTGHHCAQPLMDFYGISAALRISFALYNNCEEVDYFVDSLCEVLETLR